MNLTVAPAILNTISPAICMGQSFTFNGISYTTTTSATATFASASGCDSIVTMNLTVAPAILNTISPTICSGETYLFNGVTYSTSSTIAATFQDANGCDSIVTMMLTVNPTPTVPSTTNIAYCQNETATILLPNGAQYLWYTSAIGGTSTPNILPQTTTPGTTIYYVSGILGTCESARTPLQVTVNPTPSAPGTSGNLNLCLGQSATSLSASGQQLQWYADAALDSPLANAPIIYTTQPGSATFFVTQTINGCTSLAASITATVNETPFAAFVVSKNPVCEYENFTANFTGSSTANLNYQWMLSSGGSVLAGAGTQQLSASFSNVSTGTVSLIVTANGCTSNTASQSITIKPAPQARFTLPADGCVGVEIVAALNQALTPDATYEWTFDDATVRYGTDAGPYGLTWDTAGEKTVTMIARAAGCPSGAQQQSIAIHPTPAAKILVAQQPRDLYCTGDTVQLEAVSQPNYSYTWTPTRQVADSSDPASPLISVPASGSIKLTVASMFGCAATDSIYLKNKACCEVAMPTAFTPNGDGRNDNFGIITEGHQQVLRFRIVDRWGVQVLKQPIRLRAGMATTTVSRSRLVLITSH